jgi:hypothetical protein
MLSPEAPEIKKSFLVQFAWSDMLSDQELSNVLAKYENEIKLQLIMQKEKFRRALHFPNRSTRERLIWEMISENIISTYNNELNWVRETRQKLFKKEVMGEKDKMNYQIREIENKKYRKGRFKEMAMETNKGNHFRLYDNKEEAEKWLLK